MRWQPINLIKYASGGPELWDTAVEMFDVLGWKMEPWLTSENEEDKCLCLKMTDQKEGLNSVIAHTLLHFLCRNLICSLSCAEQLPFLSLSFSCGPGHFWAGLCHVRWIESFALITKECCASACHCNGCISHPWEILFPII